MLEWKYNTMPHYLPPKVLFSLFFLFWHTQSGLGWLGRRPWHLLILVERDIVFVLVSLARTTSTCACPVLCSFESLLGEDVALRWEYRKSDRSIRSNEKREKLTGWGNTSSKVPPTASSICTFNYIEVSYRAFRMKDVVFFFYDFCFPQWPKKKFISYSYKMEIFLYFFFFVVQRLFPSGRVHAERAFFFLSFFEFVSPS